jgi:hypothetical protein
LLRRCHQVRLAAAAAGLPHAQQQLLQLLLKWSRLRGRLHHCRFLQLQVLQPLQLLLLRSALASLANQPAQQQQLMTQQQGLARLLPLRPGCRAS